MTHLTFIRYFVPDSNEFAPGWYQTRNEGRTRIGDVPLSLSDALYDGPNRVIIDDNTPETNTLPVSGGKGVDEFLITRTANSVVIDDDSEANVIVFERDVVITSIERPAGSEGASVAQYVITLSSGKTITLRNPASFTFQHLGDATRTAPISAEDFFTAYEDGFAASDASHPDIIGDASGPSGSDIVGTAYEGDLSTSGDLDVNSDVTLATTTPFTISTAATYGTASINDDGEWEYTLDNGNTDVRALNSGDTLTDTFVVNVTDNEGSAQTQTITITISGRTDVLGTNGPDFISEERTSDNVAIFGFNSADTLTGGSGDDLLVGGYGADTIDLSVGGTDTVVYRINSSDDDGLIKAEDGGDTVMEFTPGEDKLVILDVNGSPTTLTDLFDSLTGGAFQLGISGDTDGDFVLSSSELDAGARAFIDIVFQANGTPDGDPASVTAGLTFKINFDRVTSEALNDMAVWDTLTGGTDFSASTISTVALLSSLFGGFGRPGYDAALDDGGFISIIGPDDLPDSYFEIPPQTISGDETGSVTEGGAPGDDNTGRLTAPGHTITLVSKKTTDSPGMSTGTYGVMRFDGRIWTYTLDDRAEVLADQQTETESFTFSAGGGTYVVTITVTGVNDAPTVSGEFFTKVGAAGGQFILSNLSDRFTDVDQGDELTFTVTLDDGAALSTIGLTYDSDEDEITGTLAETGTYVIKIVATDKSGATVEATFDLNILLAISIIQRNSLTYNPDVTSITIDETMLEVISGNASDPTLLVYTITTLPDAGVLLKSGTPLNNGDTFTQADINNGLITYVPDVSDPSTSQSNPLSFTISDGVATLEATLEITSREVVGNTASAQDNTADFSDVDVPQKIEAGDGSDIITGGQKDDQIDGGAGDDEIILTRTINNVAEDAGADEVLYEFGYDGVGIDGGDEIVGFKRGQDKVTFVVQDSRQFTNLEEFLGSLKGADDEDLTADDAFIVTMQWGTDEAGAFYFDGVLLHFKDATSFGGGRVSSPLVTVTFDQQLDLNDLTEILGGADKVAANFDFTHAAFKNLDEVLPRLFGESSIDFVVLPFSNSISVIDGPVTGAEVFFDIDDDGEVSDVEKDAQRDASGRSLYITGDDGSVSIPEEYVGLAFVADVDSAYDTATGERLEGAFRSLDEGRGGIATPITDLIVTYLEEVEGQAGTPTTEQEVLDEIFGDGEVTLADVLDAGNYEIPADTNTPENNKKDLISRAAIALTEIKENNDLTDGDGDGSTTKVEIVSALKTLVDLPDDSSVADLKATVDARVAEVNAVKGGKPIATPTPTSVDGVEDTDYAFPDTLEALTGFFGFRDPGGNDPAADTSSFRGVYIRIAIENASLRLDDNTQVVADTDLSGSDTVDAITGYVYVAFDNLDGLKITPAPNFNGDLALVYRVWDGEEVSSDAELIINIAGVNDAPVVDTAIGPQRGTVDLPITAIILENLFSDVDDDELTLTVMGLPRGLSYARDTGITGTPDTVGTFTVMVVADDGNGGMVETTFDIVVGQIMNALTGTISLANPTPPNNLQGAYGALKFDAATKTWTYTPDAAARQALRAGEERTETFTFTDSSNAVTELVTITVVGVNDAPVVDTAIGPQRVTVDLPITAIILENLFSDVDDDVLTLTVTRLPSGLSYARDTGITGTPDTVGTFTVTVMANDGNGGIVQTTFDIVVAEGQVVISEDGDPVSGTISLADPTDPGVLQGTYGELTFDADTKTWTYTLDNTSAAVQALGAGEERTETFTFTDATDGTTEDVEITVVGVNDAPEITAVGVVSVQDGDTSFASDILTIVDVDEGDIAKLTSGSFTLTAGTGATAAIVNKFEVVQDTNGRWQLQLKSGQSFVLADAATFIINVSVTDAGGLTDNVDVTFNVASARVLIDAGNSDIVGAAFEGDLSTSGDLDPESDVTLASTTPFTISTAGTYGTASIGDDGEWVYTLDNGHPDVRALNSGQTLTDTFVVNVTATDGAQTQTITITIIGKTDVLGTNGPDSSLGDASTGDNQAIFGFNSADTLTGGSGDDLLVGGYGEDTIDLSAGGADTVVYRINSSDTDGFVKAEDGGDTVIEFTPGEDKLVILDVNGSLAPVTFAALFDSLSGNFQLGISGDTDVDFVLSSSELDAGARAFLNISFEASGTVDGGPSSNPTGGQVQIIFDRVTSEALNDMTVWDTLTGGTDFSKSTISTAAMLSSLFGGFGRPGYDAALDDGDFISIIGLDDLPDSYFEIA